MAVRPQLGLWEQLFLTERLALVIGSGLLIVAVAVVLAQWLWLGEALLPLLPVFTVVAVACLLLLRAWRRCCFVGWLVLLGLALPAWQGQQAAVRHDAGPWSLICADLSAGLADEAWVAAVGEALRSADSAVLLLPDRLGLADAVARAGGFASPFNAVVAADPQHGGPRRLVLLTRRAATALPQQRSRGGEDPALMMAVDLAGGRRLAALHLPGDHRPGRSLPGPWHVEEQRAAIAAALGAAGPHAWYAIPHGPSRLSPRWRQWVAGSQLRVFTLPPVGFEFLGASNAPGLVLPVGVEPVVAVLPLLGVSAIACRLP